MTATAMPSVAHGDLRNIIPDPMALRELIGVRAAELAVLRRLLKVSESQARISQPVLTNTTTSVNTDAR